MNRLAKLKKPDVPTPGSSSFQISNIITDPFAISTLSICILSWIIAFVGSIVSDIDDSFPRFTWWGLVFQLLMMVLLFLFYCFDLVDQYKIFIVGGYAIAFIYTTNSATNLVYSDGSDKAAASAGVILLSMINIIWVFYYGGDNSSPVNRWIDSFSLRGPRSSNNPFNYRNQVYGYNDYDGASKLNEDFRHSTGSQKFVSSSQLNGLENFSERDPVTSTAFETPVSYDQHSSMPIRASAPSGIQGESDTVDTNFVIDDFPYTARALYSYESNPEDENEISFEKGEVLKVNDIHSRWWQAKKSNGEIGICPSNYVELIE